MLYNELINIILLRRINKIIVQKNDTLNEYFIKNFNDSFKTNLFNSSLEVEKCTLLNCTLYYNNVKLEFENGNLINKNDETEKIPNKNKIEEIVSAETEKIREKLKIPLTLNENIYHLGYCMNIDLVNKIALYNQDDIEMFTKSFISNLIKLEELEYNPPFPNFPRQHIDSNSFLSSYSKWLTILESLNCNENKKVSPSTENNINEANKIKNLKIKVISTTDKYEFRTIMSDVMNSFEPFSETDISDLIIFFQKTRNGQSYVPNTIPNKYNLPYVAYFLTIKNIFYYNNIKEITDKIIKLYEDSNYNTDDILKMALVFSNYSASDINKIQDFNYQSIYQGRHIIFKLLEKCNNRYHYFLKYKYQWLRLTDCIALLDYKNTYPEVVSDLLKIQKPFIFNKIFIEKRHKIMFNKKDDLNDFFKISIEKAIEDDDILSSSEYSISVNTCHLLYCSLTINNGYNQVTVEFENGELLTSTELFDKSLMIRVQDIIKKQTNIISKKLFYILSFNTIIKF